MELNSMLQGNRSDRSDKFFSHKQKLATIPETLELDLQKEPLENQAIKIKHLYQWLSDNSNDKSAEFSLAIKQYSVISAVLLDEYVQNFPEACHVEDIQNALLGLGKLKEDAEEEAEEEDEEDEDKKSEKYYRSKSYSRKRVVAMILVSSIPFTLKRDFFSSLDIESLDILASNIVHFIQVFNNPEIIIQGSLKEYIKKENIPPLEDNITTTIKVGNVSLLIAKALKSRLENIGCSHGPWIEVIQEKTIHVQVVSPIVQKIANRIKAISGLELDKEQLDLLDHHQQFLNGPNFNINDFYIHDKELRDNTLKRIIRHILKNNESDISAWKKCVETTSKQDDPINSIREVLAYDVLLRYLRTLDSDKQMQLNSDQVQIAKKCAIGGLYAEELRSGGRLMRELLNDERISLITQRYPRLLKILFSEYIPHCAEDCRTEAIRQACEYIEQAAGNKSLSKETERAIQVILIANVPFKKKKEFLSELQLDILDLLVCNIEVLFLHLRGQRGPWIKDEESLGSYINRCCDLGACMSEAHEQIQKEIQEVVNNRLADSYGMLRNASHLEETFSNRQPSP